MNENNNKKKKKDVPVIISKVRPLPNSPIVCSSHYEPSWNKPVPVIDPSTASYYPAGQRTIEGNIFLITKAILMIHSFK